MPISEQTAQLIQLVASILGIFGFTIGGFWIAIWATVRRAVNKKFEKEADNAIRKAIEQLLPSMQERIVAEAQSNMVVLSQVLSFHSLNQYDDVLTAINWDGKAEKLRGFNKKIRHCVIRSLYNCKVNRKANREAAWTALEDLFNEGNVDPDTLSLMLSIGISSKRYEETRKKVSEMVEGVTNPSILVLISTLYRKLQDPKRAEKYARTAHDLHPSSETALALSVLLRDQGLFERANDILYPQVSKFSAEISRGRTKWLPDGWQRLFNTYIANKIDMGDEQNCLGEALILSQHLRSPVENATLGRYLLGAKSKLASLDAEKHRELLSNFKGSIAQMPDNEAGQRCVAIELQLDGNLFGAIDKIRSLMASRPDWMKKGDEAYLNCYLAAMLLEADKVDDAIPVMVSVDHALVNGEAEYLLAKCFARKSRGPEARAWLDKAISRQGRWLSKARKNPHLLTCSEVATLLAERSSNID